MQRRILLGWSVGSFTSAALVGAVSLLHLRYMTDSLGLAIGVAGLLVVVSKVYDAVLDPLMGIAADRTTTPWGRHRPYLLGGSLLAAVSLVMLFNVPHALAGKWLVGYCGVSLLVFSTAYTMFRIPYLALGRRLTQNFHERSQLMTYSVYGSSFGGMAATSAAPLLLAKLGSDRAAHGLLAWLLAGLVALGGAATFALLRASEAEHGGTDDAREHFSAAATWRALVGNRPFAGLIGFKMVMFSGLTLHGAALPFYTRHALHSTDISISSIFLAQTITMMLSQPAWVRIARRLGRRRALVLAAMLEALAMLCWFLVPAAAPSPWVQIIGGFEGICIGGLFFGLYTMLTDTMDHAQAAPGASSQEAMLAGVFVMVEKATAAFGTFLFSLMMAWAGFVSGHDTGAVQPAGVVLGIMLSMSLIPALAALAACLFLRPPPKTDATTAAVQPVASLTVVAGLLAMLVSAGLGLAPAPARAAEPAPAAPVRPGITITRIASGPDGKSHAEPLVLPGSDPQAVISRLRATDVEIGEMPPGTFIDWHRVTTPRLLVVLKGAMEVGTGDGRRHILRAGDMALAADMTGQGHTSRSLGHAPVLSMTVRLPADNLLQSRSSACPDGTAPQACVANHLSIQHQPD